MNTLAHPISLNDNLAPTIWLGGVISFIFFIVIGGWAAFAPLAGAVVASGEVTVEGYRKVVQHLEGGIIKEILVNEGDLVQEGQTLIRLDDTNVRANVQILGFQYHSMRATEARLLAERDGLAAIRFTDELIQNTDPDVEGIVQGQVNIFNERKKTLEGEISLFHARIEQLREQIKGTRAQEESQRQQGKLIREELKGTRELFEKGFGSKIRMMALERAAAALEGQMAEYGSTIARLEESIGETELRILQRKKDRLTEVTTQLAEAQEKVYSLAEKLNSAKEVMQRLDIKAPESGRVVSLRKTTQGGIVSHGEVLLELVPQKRKLVIEAAVQPNDISGVFFGAKAEVHLTAFSRREIPTVPGVVSYVSADKMPTADGRGFFKIRVDVDMEEIDKIKDVFIMPGMPMDITIPTKERTVMDYLLAPLSHGIQKAFRER